MRSKRGRQPALGTDPAKAREQIIRTFLDRARRSGIRSIVMGEFASDLHMSVSTLYRHFPSKRELVAACVERWAEDLAAVAAIAPGAGRKGASGTMLMGWAEVWAEAVSQYSTAWWTDLRKGYPEAWAIFERAMRGHKARGAALLRPALRDDVHPETALAVLELLLDRLPDPEFSEKLGVTRREAVRTALSVWMDGALDRGAGRGRRTRGDLRLVDERSPNTAAMKPKRSGTGIGTGSES